MHGPGESLFPPEVHGWHVRPLHSSRQASCNTSLLTIGNLPLHLESQWGSWTQHNLPVLPSGDTLVD